MKTLNADVATIPDYFFNEGYDKACWYMDNMDEVDIPYVSTTRENNGITTYVSESNRKGNLITLTYGGRKWTVEQQLKKNKNKITCR